MGWLKVFTALVMIVLVAVWVINAFVVVVTKQQILPSLDDAPGVDAVIVPGASVYRSGKLSPVLQRRMEAGLQFLALDENALLVLSGYAIPQGYNETAAMLEFARKNLVEEKRIRTDEGGRSTYVTLLNCKRRLGLQRVLIVSQDYHLPRALYIARGLGMEAYGFSVEQSPASRFHWREYFSRTKDFVLLRVSGLFNAR